MIVINLENFTQEKFNTIDHYWRTTRMPMAEIGNKSCWTMVCHWWFLIDRLRANIGKKGHFIMLL